MCYTSVWFYINVWSDWSDLLFCYTYTSCCVWFVHCSNNLFYFVLFKVLFRWWNSYLCDRRIFYILFQMLCCSIDELLNINSTFVGPPSRLLTLLGTKWELTPTVKSVMFEFQKWNIGAEFSIIIVSIKKWMGFPAFWIPSQHVRLGII